MKGAWRDAGRVEQCSPLLGVCLGSADTKELHAQVSGVAEGVYSFGPNGEQRPQILAELEASATEKAVRSGAAPSRCQVPWKRNSTHCP